jgi:quercetin dioxygenase-like cupin family protein
VSNLVDVDTLRVLDVWGEAVRARRVEGERVTLALIELAPNAVVPGHRHENEQLGMVITGSLTFTVGDETRALGPGGMWRIPPDTPHQVSVGAEGAVAIDIFAPTRADWDALPSNPASRPLWPPRESPAG